MKSLSDINIEKSRSGVYQNTSENRRLHRVGQRYGQPKKEEVPASKLLGTGDIESIMEDISDKFFDSKVSAKEKRAYIENYIGEGEYDRLWQKLSSKQFDSSTDKKNAFMEEVFEVLMNKQSIQSKPEVKTPSKVKNEGGSNRNESSEKESKARELARVRAMTNDELAAEYFGFDRNKYEKADKDFKEARSAFVKKWGDGLEGVISRISSMKDIEELLKDSTALLEKQELVFDSSPFTSKTLAALRTRITNAAKKGKDIKNLRVVMSVEPERGFWKDGDFLASTGENFALNLIKDSKYTNSAKMGNTLFWTESDLKYGDKLELSAEEHNKLASIIAGEQGDPENYNERGEAKIGGYEDFKNVVEGLGSRKKENSAKDGKFSRMNLPDIPNAHKVNLTKYLSAKRKKAVDDAWDKAKFDSLSRENAGVFQEGYNKLREQFNNNFDDMSKSERAELLYKILKMKNAMERK